MAGCWRKAKAFAGLLVLTFSIEDAAAQQRWVTFGDSLSDRGNLFALSGNTQPPQPYFNGRFSNGPVWVESIAGAQAGWTGGVTPSGSLNFAFGGSRTDTILAPGPGTATQVGAFFAGGGTFGATDIVTMWAGANDIFQAIAVPANQNSVAISSVATTAASNVVAQIGQIAAAGARTIVVMNLPDLGAAPQFNTSGAAPLASLAAVTFNTTLTNGLATVAQANPNTRILQVNAAALFGAVRSDPSAFGFTNVTQQCLTTPACVTGSTATQNTYLFWDGVHPTARGHAFVAQAVQQYLNAPIQAAAAASITEIGVHDRRLAAQRSLDRLRGYHPQAEKTDIYIAIIGDQTAVKARSSMPGYTYSAGGIEIGILRHLNDRITLGGAASVKTGESSSSVQGNKISMQPTSFTLDMLARWSGQQGFFAQAALGTSLTRINEFERVLGIASLSNKGETLSAAFSAVGQIGQKVKLGNLTFEPSVKLGYLSGNTRSFSETGAIAPISYRGRTVSAFLAAADLRTDYQFAPNLTGHVVIGYEALLGQTGAQLRGALADSPGSDFSTGVGKVESPGLTFGVGLSGLVGGFQAHLDYRGAVAAGGQISHRGSIGGRIGF
ncbi:autotransporter domain-containing protein [Rhabdaerophilum sp. SD176]|uniref:autotransporter domain-containing protein n=1 Tax=Rhabdaerophilum sp. SD176 TaxID=2983548 RepID=UPI0024DFF632|nr:autotransporter domain-containing protein [Rhabdaerophilum sp. SD176]